MKKITYQRLRKENEDKYALAEKYYSVLSVLNNLGLTERELQLIAHTAIRGSISYANVRDEFCRKYNTSDATINNIISRMKRKKIFVKENRKIGVNPAILLDFNRDVVMEIKLVNGRTDKA